MYVESYHRVFKEQYLAADGKKRRENFRIDRLIFLLQQFFIDKVRQRQAKQEKGKVSYRLSELHKRHKASLNISDESVKQFKGK